MILMYVNSVVQETNNTHIMHINYDRNVKVNASQPRSNISEVKARRGRDFTTYSTTVYQSHKMTASLSTVNHVTEHASQSTINSQSSPVSHQPTHRARQSFMSSPVSHQPTHRARQSFINQLTALASQSSTDSQSSPVSHQSTHRARQSVINRLTEHASQSSTDSQSSPVSHQPTHRARQSVINRLTELASHSSTDSQSTPVSHQPTHRARQSFINRLTELASQSSTDSQSSPVIHQPTHRARQLVINRLTDHSKHKQQSVKQNQNNVEYSPVTIVHHINNTDDTALQQHITALQPTVNINLSNMSKQHNNPLYELS